MTGSFSCPTCGERLTPQQVRRRVKCRRCEQGLRRKEVAGPAPGETPASCTVRAAFWLGLASLILGVGSGLSGLLRATADWSLGLAWLSVLLGGSALVLAVVWEECSFTCPFAGSVVGLLSLALVVYWLNAPGRPPAGMLGRWPPPPALDIRQPPGRSGGPAVEKGRGVRPSDLPE
jgi:hypothetical protein